MIYTLMQWGRKFVTFMNGTIFQSWELMEEGPSNFLDIKDIYLYKKIGLSKELYKQRWNRQ